MHPIAILQSSGVGSLPFFFSLRPLHSFISSTSLIRRTSPCHRSSSLQAQSQRRHILQDFTIEVQITILAFKLAIIPPPITYLCTSCLSALDTLSLAICPADLLNNTFLILTNFSSYSGTSTAIILLFIANLRILSISFL